MLSILTSAFKFEKIDPPGSWCNYSAVMDLVKSTKAKSFLEVGCGAGELSKRLCQMGLTGIGVDFSAQAIEQAKVALADQIAKGQYKLIQGDIAELDQLGTQVDLGVSLMVMEHVDDDVNFLKQTSKFVKPGGHVLVGVPGRKDRWCFEDETVGHLRRYDRWDLTEVFGKAGMNDSRVLSVAVPVANILFNASNFLIRKSDHEVRKTEMSKRIQTETSGIREIKFKTVFPRFTKLILNKYTLSPLFMLQKLFYGTNLGLTQLAIGKVPERSKMTH